MSIVDTDSEQWQMGRRVARKFQNQAGPEGVQWLRNKATLVVTEMPNSSLFEFAHGALTTLNERAQEVSS